MLDRPRGTLAILGESKSESLQGMLLPLNHRLIYRVVEDGLIRAYELLYEKGRRSS